VEHLNTEILREREPRQACLNKKIIITCYTDRESHPLEKKLRAAEMLSETKTASAAEDRKSI